MPSPESHAKLFCLDTTGSELMLALAEGPARVFEHRERSESQRYHSAMLIPLIQDALKQSGWALRELQGLAVNVGPGSFTGIRTGMTSIRLLGQFLDLPVHVFNTFELLAAQYPNEAVAVSLDALRGRAYHASLCVGEAGGLRYLDAPALLPLDALPDTPVTRRIASDSLLDRLPEPTEATSGLNCFTPDSMLRLLDLYPEAFRQPWEAVLPLYLQEPNITQRKAQPGLMK